MYVSMCTVWYVCILLIISSVVVLEEVVGTPGHTYFTAQDRNAK